MHDTEDPTRSSAADAAGMAADYSARHTYARGYDDGRKAEKARADAAEAKIYEVECARILAERDRDEAEERANRAERAHGETMARLTRAIDAAIARAEKAEAKARAYGDIVHACTPALERAGHPLGPVPADTIAACVDALAKARDELGIQLAAAQARIKLLEEGATLLRHIDEFKGEQKWGANGANHYHVSCDVIDIGVGCFLSALDTVPGDALAPSAIVGVHPCGKERPVGAVGVAQTASGERFFIDGNGDRIDTSNVKGGE